MFALSAHRFARGGPDFDVIPVDLVLHKSPGGSDHYAVNAKGAVPVLELDNGECFNLGNV